MSISTENRLRCFLDYSQETGMFFWKVNRGNIKAGTEAGTFDKHGYRQICLDRKFYFAHRLAWLFAYGQWPTGEIDHINRVRCDNRLSNLRTVTRSENCQNVGLQRNNTSGQRGVYWNKRDKYWQVRIIVCGKYNHVGCFKSLENARAAYLDAAKKFHTHNPMLEADSLAKTADVRRALGMLAA